MQFPTILLAAAIAILPAVQAIDPGNWISVDCYVTNVKVNGSYVDTNRSLKYDWQLTQQTCNNNYDGAIVSASFENRLEGHDAGFPQAKYSMGAGRCVSTGPNGINGAQWWANCQRQALNGWYDVNGATGDIIIDGLPYTSDWAEGRGYPAGPSP